MKYSIFGFDQRSLCTINASNEQKIDCTDLVIIQWIAEFIAREKTRKIMLEGNVYAWVSQTTLAGDFPFMEFSKRTFTDRLDKLSEIGIIDKRVEKQKGYGTFTYLRLTSMYDNLLYTQDEGGAVQTTSGCGFNNTPGAVQTTPKDLYTNTPIYETIKKIDYPYSENPNMDNETQLNIEYKEENIEKNKKENISSSSISYSDIKDLWNSKCSMLTTVTTITSKRQEKIRARFKEFATVGEPMDVLNALLDKISQSKWMTEGSRENWRKGLFDWLFANSENWVKVWEGKYNSPEQSISFGSDSNSQYEFDKYGNKVNKQIWQ